MVLLVQMLICADPRSPGDVCPLRCPSCSVFFLLMTLCIMDNLAVSKMAAVFKPIIRWAQSKERIFLTLELSDVQVW